MATLHHLVITACEVCKKNHLERECLRQVVMGSGGIQGVLMNQNDQNQGGQQNQQGGQGGQQGGQQDQKPGQQQTQKPGQGGQQGGQGGQQNQNK